MSFGTAVGTDVAAVRGMVVEVTPAFGFGVVIAREVVVVRVVDPGAGAEEGLEEEQPAKPRMHRSAAIPAALEPEIKSFFSRGESVPTPLGACEHRGAGCPSRRLVASGGACAFAGWSPV
jgi:hypothetical protein